MINFHRFLIGTAILFCAGFAWWAMRTGATAFGIGFAAAAAGLTYYLWNLRRFLYGR